MIDALHPLQYSHVKTNVEIFKSENEYLLNFNTFFQFLLGLITATSYLPIS